MGLVPLKPPLRPGEKPPEPGSNLWLIVEGVSVGLLGLAVGLGILTMGLLIFSQ